MKISLDVIRSYTRKVTSGRAMNTYQTLDDLELFDDDIQLMFQAAKKNGDLDWLRLSLQALILKPKGRVQNFVSLHATPLSDMEFVQLFTYAYKKLWPDSPLGEPGDEADFQFRSMQDEDWQIVKKSGGTF